MVRNMRLDNFVLPSLFDLIRACSLYKRHENWKDGKGFRHGFLERWRSLPVTDRSGGVEDQTATLAKRLYETLEGKNAIDDRSGEQDLMMMRELEETLD